MDAKGEQAVFNDDCVAVFIQPDPAQSVYYQMAFTAGGVKFDQQVKGGARSYEFAPPWEVRAAVTDAGWVAEVKLPASSLEARIDQSKPWAFNAHRAFRHRMAPPSSWSYSPVSWHDVERFGVLEFR